MELTDLPVVIPSGGVLIVLVWLIVHQMRQSSGDRDAYQKRLVELRKEHTAEIKELTTRHDAQITDLRNDIRLLRDEVADLREQIEAERRARWHAEDAAAKYRRMIEQHDAGETSDDERT